MTRAATNRLAVVGGGTMGRGIAEVAARAGIAVTLVDADVARAKAAIDTIGSGLRPLEAKGKVPAGTTEATLGQLTPAGRLADVRDSDVVVEAVFEDLALKQDMFRELEAYVAPEALLASNTSALSITGIAARCRHPERVVGLHFFNPVPRMALVEIVAGTATGVPALDAASDLAGQLGKTAVHAKDSPGFIVNRVARPFYLEALKMLAEGSWSAAVIDAGVRAGGFRMGPFELMDLIGIDVNLAVTRAVYDGYFQEPRFRPSPIQRGMVEAGRLGRKTGQGFYSYVDGTRQEPEMPAPEADPADPLCLPWLSEPCSRLVALIINEAYFALGEGVASPRDIDLAMKLGTNYPLGPFEWSERLGLERVVAVLDALRAYYGEERYRTAPALRRALSPTPTI